MQPQDTTQPTQQPIEPTVVQPAAVEPNTAQPLQSAVPVVSTMPDASLPADLPVTASHPWRKRLAVIVVILVLLGGIAAGAYTWMGRQSKQNATKTAQAFIADLNTGNTARAYQMLTTSMRSSQTKDQFVQSIGDLTATAPKYTAQNLTINGQSATYTASEDGLPATATGRTDGQFTITLAKQGMTDWQISGVKVE